MSMSRDEAWIPGLEVPRREAVEQLVDRYWARAYRVARLHLGEDEAAQDVTQAAFVKLLRAAGRHDPEEPLAPLVFRTLINTAHRHPRSRGQRQSADVDALGALRPGDRLALLLTSLETLSSEHAGAVLACHPAKVASRAKRGSEQLAATWSLPPLGEGTGEDDAALAKKLGEVLTVAQPEHPDLGELMAQAEEEAASGRSSALQPPPPEGQPEPPAEPEYVPPPRTPDPYEVAAQPRADERQSQRRWLIPVGALLLALLAGGLLSAWGALTGGVGGGGPGGPGGGQSGFVPVATPRPSGEAQALGEPRFDVFVPERVGVGDRFVLDIGLPEWPGAKTPYQLEAQAGPELAVHTALAPVPGAPWPRWRIELEAVAAGQTRVLLIARQPDYAGGESHQQSYPLEVVGRLRQVTLLRNSVLDGPETRVTLSLDEEEAQALRPPRRLALRVLPHALAEARLVLAGLLRQPRGSLQSELGAGFTAGLVLELAKSSEFQPTDPELLGDARQVGRAAAGALSGRQDPGGGFSQRRFGEGTASPWVTALALRSLTGLAHAGLLGEADVLTDAGRALARAQAVDGSWPALQASALAPPDATVVVATAQAVRVLARARLQPQAVARGRSFLRAQDVTQLSTYALAQLGLALIEGDEPTGELDRLARRLVERAEPDAGEGVAWSAEWSPPPEEDEGAGPRDPGVVDLRPQPERGPEPQTWAEQLAEARAKRARIETTGVVIQVLSHAGYRELAGHGLGWLARRRTARGFGSLLGTVEALEAFRAARSDGRPHGRLDVVVGGEPLAELKLEGREPVPIEESDEPEAGPENGIALPEHQPQPSPARAEPLRLELELASEQGQELRDERIEQVLQEGLDVVYRGQGRVMIQLVLAGQVSWEDGRFADEALRTREAEALALRVQRPTTSRVGVPQVWRIELTNRTQALLPAPRAELALPPGFVLGADQGGLRDQVQSGVLLDWTVGRDWLVFEFPPLGPGIKTFVDVTLVPMLDGQFTAATTLAMPWFQRGFSESVVVPGAVRVLPPAPPINSARTAEPEPEAAPGANSPGGAAPGAPTSQPTGEASEEDEELEAVNAGRQGELVIGWDSTALGPLKQAFEADAADTNEEWQRGSSFTPFRQLTARARFLTVAELGTVFEVEAGRAADVAVPGGLTWSDGEPLELADLEHTFVRAHGAMGLAPTQMFFANGLKLRTTGLHQLRLSNKLETGLFLQRLNMAPFLIRAQRVRGPDEEDVPLPTLTRYEPRWEANELIYDATGLSASGPRRVRIVPINTPGDAEVMDLTWGRDTNLLAPLRSLVVVWSLAPVPLEIRQELDRGLSELSSFFARQPGYVAHRLMLPNWRVAEEPPGGRPNRSLNVIALGRDEALLEAKRLLQQRFERQGWVPVGQNAGLTLFLSDGAWPVPDEHERRSEVAVLAGRKARLGPQRLEPLDGMVDPAGFLVWPPLAKPR